MNKHLLSLHVFLSVFLDQGIVRAQTPPYWNKGAESLRWQWDERAASPFGSMEHINPKYNIRLLFKNENDSHQLYISVLEGEREVFTFKGHSRTVYYIWDDCLYYANFSYISDGAEIVAVNLKTGKELWKSPLAGIGSQMHSEYSNSLNLEADPFSVKVFGKESNGQYFESKRADTGETIAHKIFTRDDTDPSAIAVRDAVERYYAACQLGYLPAVKRLINAGLNVTASYSGEMVDWRGKSALHVAADKGDPTIVEYLLDKAHPIDSPDQRLLTPLHHAIESAQRAAKAAQGVAKPTVLAETGLTELQGALKSCRILIQRGAALQEPWSSKLREVAEASDDTELVRLIEQTSATKPKPLEKSSKP